ncbi:MULTISPECIES: sensor histidine kinase [Streptomyces]|uniref:Signal transduction histidine kinase subgroup 3 dimerisation and phosphoacceptor domain-containing protein n=2 Tax=Streptomyces TaxID=1883 RepID=A0A2N8P8H8_STRNR|nr:MULTISPECIES: histidine kinase [Streptomyces]PNE37331.1 hypothetical protein AOB60_23650 [Streptomyces noursei]SHM24177.1 two-component system, NarL family, sensor histidine kinase DesK [Streptomyces yunnanensis]
MSTASGAAQARHQIDVKRATAHTRWMLCLIPWLLLASLLWPLLSHLDHADADRLPPAIGWVIATLTALQGLGATTAVAYSIGRARHSATLIGAMAAVTLLELALLPWAHDVGLLDSTRSLIPASIMVALPLSFALSSAMGRRAYTAMAVGESVLAGGAVLVADRAAAPAVLAFTAATWVVIGSLMRSSMWFLTVLWQLNAAREAQTRLVIAEERLRFARDLHDVIGSDLSVIALKAELAERLAQAPEARSEMAQVQSLTRGLHNEIREVVNGYRTTDLTTELQGAQAVLEAAGVSCRIHQEGDVPLPQEAQTALGWVVREGVTNVLRHAQASTCTIRLTGTGHGPTRLDIVNDGTGRQTTSEGGNGLAGLVERLAPLGGTVSHGRAAGPTYRLTVHLPRQGNR